ncbi:peptide-methionine (R)-S-oxide reductase, partial [Ferruginibacter sp.]|uniref:peptide-methionine (R)-S-oxide reductase n=1 Tax=Ferruginibacter sp. TaxID=1940288 RepID=UPI0019CE9F4D
MKNILSITAFLILLAGTSCGQTRKKQVKSYPIKKTESEWKKILSPVAFQIMVKGGTEAPFNNPYNDNHEKGIYV